MSKVIWIDTETTGLDPKIHGLREVSFLIEIDGLIVAEKQLYINPMTYNKEIYISKYVREKMNISENKLVRTPCSHMQYEEFTEILNKYVDRDDPKDKFQMAGFNVEFDYNMIKAWFQDLWINDIFNQYFAYQTIDVLSLVRHLKYLKLFKTENNKLETLCNHFEIDINAHNALSDIQATKILHQVLVEDFIKKGN